MYLTLQLALLHFIGQIKIKTFLDKKMYILLIFKKRFKVLQTIYFRKFEGFYDLMGKSLIDNNWKKKLNAFFFGSPNSLDILLQIFNSKQSDWPKNLSTIISFLLNSTSSTTYQLSLLYNIHTLLEDTYNRYN